MNSNLLLLTLSTQKIILENISEQNSIFLLGDFNINLLNYNGHNQTNELLDSLASAFNFTTNQNN